MKTLTRFGCPSVGLDLRHLARKHYKLGWCSLALAAMLHLSLSQVAGRTAQQRVSRPLTTKFVKRAPRLSKPLELKKRPRPKRRELERRMVSVQARAARGADLSVPRPVGLVQGLARPKARVSRGTSFLSAAAEPEALAQSIEGSKEAKSAVDMSLEMLDIEALNTGRYHALVVQDPADRRNLRGFCHLSVLYIPRVHTHPIPHQTTAKWFEWYVVGSVRHLAEAMNRYTAVKTDVLGKVQFGDEELFKTPWIFTFASSLGYELSDTEVAILGEYLMRGGFVFADGYSRQSIRTGGLFSHQKALLGAAKTLGIDSRFEDLPDHHPIFHCYFDFDGPMQPYAAYGNPYLDGKLEGLEIHGRLVAILSSMAYYSPWSDWGPETISSSWYQNADPTRHYQFGVNLIVFALTQEGSITSRVMDTVSY